MRFGQTSVFVSACLIVAATPASANPKVRRGPTAPRIVKSRISKAKTAGIDPARATQIQTALIKAGYLNNEPSGTWDAPTQAAMEKMQADNGWQTKLVPDSRAIIKLGLGPGSTGGTLMTTAPSHSPQVRNFAPD